MCLVRKRPALFCVIFGVNDAPRFKWNSDSTVALYPYYLFLALYRKKCDTVLTVKTFSKPMAWLEGVTCDKEFFLQLLSLFAFRVGRKETPYHSLHANENPCHLTSPIMLPSNRRYYSSWCLAI